jgi:beta-N-acetylhexosaminidase
MKKASLVIVAFGLIACNTQAQPPKYVLEPQKSSAAAASAKPTLADRYYGQDALLDKKVDSIYRMLNNKQRAAQMIMTASSPSDKLGFPFATASKLVAEDIAANVVFLKGTAAVFKRETAQLNKSKSSSALPPLFACDCEPSLITSKWSDVRGIKPASQQRDSSTVVANTQRINDVMKATGVQLNFAPVVDNAINKSVINTRSFGNDAATIARLSQIFVSASQDAGIGATLKHFPGHGAVKGDSHKQSVYIDGALTELPTFKQLIQSSEPPISVMVGHIVVKNNEKYNTRGLPATLSPVIVTDLLRNELGFKGIITTDALNMVAAAKIPDADWKSVLAGVDLVLMPKDARALNARIARALEEEGLLAKQLEQSIKRIIRFKLLMD